MIRLKYVEKTVEWAKEAGFNNIKAKIDGYENPFAFQRKSDNEKFSPDVTGINKETKYYFHLALKTETAEDNYTNLILLDELAKIKKSKLYVMAPAGHVKYARELIVSSKLENAEVVKI
ncbi:hypothetical protein [Lacihabitans sp. LS3-19]|uniref:hypothetical protein n=1 Tax=Lacihabitans sp. LS3-19 TaxID=2487335 RepID=UPI0020CC038C|nr:hypothetical protein [Lacihabitans sp. LS3-19]